MNQRKKDWARREFEIINHQIKGKKALSYYDFLRIRNFKLRNHTHETSESIEAITTNAFELAEHDEIAEAVRELKKLHGVGIPIASAILAMRFPNDFAIIDERVLKQIGRQDWLDDYLEGPHVYEMYIDYMRRESREAGIPLRDYERGLFEAPLPENGENE